MTASTGQVPIRHTRRFIGIALVVTGAILLALAVTYYTAVYLAGRNSGRLVFQTKLASEDTSQTTLPATPLGDALQETPGRLSAPPAEAEALYPGVSIPARLWADPRGTLDLGQSAVASDFTPVRAMGEPVAPGDASPATRLAVPAVQIDAGVEQLKILDLQNSRAYETPKHVVGHIPGTSNPGTAGNGWYFGHLESPIRGEGNVFAHLVQVPELLRDGEDVYVIAESDTRHYLYLVTGTDLLHEDELHVYGSGDSRVTLVTCFPRFKYDQRLVVTAKLVGFKEVD